MVVLVLALGALGGRGRDDRGLRTASEPEGNAVPVAAASAIPAPRPLAKDEADVIVFLEPAVTPAQVDGVRARLGDVCRVWPGSSRSCAPQHQ